MSNFELAMQRVNKAQRLMGTDSQIKSLRKKIKLAQIADKSEDKIFGPFSQKNKQN